MYRYVKYLQDVGKVFFNQISEESTVLSANKNSTICTESDKFYLMSICKYSIGVYKEGPLLGIAETMCAHSYYQVRRPKQAGDAT